MIKVPFLINGPNFYNENLPNLIADIQLAASFIQIKGIYGLKLLGILVSRTQQQHDNKDFSN